MAKRTGPENPNLVELISELKKRAIEQNASLWKRIAVDLERPSRQRRVVNISKLNRYTQPNETIIVPGKLLGAGFLDHSLTVSAFQFSSEAKEKLKKAGAKVIPLEELSRESPKGKQIRIIG